jgi:hypothetical protein
MEARGWHIFRDITTSIPDTPPSNSNICSLVYRSTFSGAIAFGDCPGYRISLDSGQGDAVLQTWTFAHILVNWSEFPERTERGDEKHCYVMEIDYLKCLEKPTQEPIMQSFHVSAHEIFPSWPTSACVRHCLGLNYRCEVLLPSLKHHKENKCPGIPFHVMGRD